jgi:hypothetical protein
MGKNNQGNTISSFWMSLAESKVIFQISLSGFKKRTSYVERG